MITSLNNFQNIQLENDITVITLDDGINHTYCSKITWDKDNWTPIGSAKLIMPYSFDIERYWIKYSGPVVIHANLNSMPQKKIEEKVHLDKDGNPKVSLNLRHFKEKQQEQEKVEVEDDETDKKGKRKKIVKINNDEYNYSFIGKVYRFKQVGKTFIIYLEDLGWKFMQKVPKDFRDTFIANQSLDDAFQAICEFMGIEFAYSIEDLHEYNFSADGYSIEKDGQIIENVPSILKEWANGTEEEEEENEEDLDESMANALDTNITPELGDLDKYKKSKKKKTSNKEKNKEKDKEKNKINNKAINATATNKQDDTNKNNTDSKEEDKEKKDSGDISQKIEDFQEEFDEKIKDLFIGNRFYNSNIADPIMNYDWITIEPKAPATDASTAGGATGTNNANNANNDGGNNFDNASASSSLQSRDKNGWYGGQLYQGGKIVLYASYINSLSPQQAKAKSQQTGTYTKDTINKLKIRAQGVRVR